MLQSPRIHVLPPELADQIAAGEVVERPASVVKELVENALDAGARRIDVDVEGGGRRLVRVVDDGCGMTPEEARLALKRHATSKIRGLDDLFTLKTMGFRGEALPSIAAVSRFALVTRTSDAVAGFRVEVEAGLERDARETGAAPGTQIEVRDLLYNVPARLKFLKSEATEAARVSEIVTRLALAHPDVHVRLRHGGRLAVDLPPHRPLLERVRAVLGRRLGGRVAPVDYEESGVRVIAFLLPPDESQTTARGVDLYIGRRSVRDRGLLHAVGMGYEGLLPQGRYPTAIVLVEPPPGTVDVNVHPQKLEVRFARPQEVYAAVRHAVRKALAAAPWLTQEQDPGPWPGPAPASALAPALAIASQAPPPVRLSDLAESYADYQERLLLGWRPAAPAAAAASAAAPATAAASAATEPASAVPLRPVEPGQPTTEQAGFFASLTYFGQVGRTYLVCEAPGELVLLDQHAAHERIAFQRLREAHAQSRPRTQRLLFPQTLELEPAHGAAVEEHAAELAALGFEIAPFGGRTFALKAAPAGLRDGEAVATVRELLDELADTSQSRAVGDRMDALLATVACHSVVRAGDPLAADEARALLASLDGVDFRAHCPHGRPVLLRIGLAEIARRFGRT